MTARVFVGILQCFIAAGCGQKVAAPTVASGSSDANAARTADISILFVGNSHTSSQDLPKLVCAMVGHLRPGVTTYHQVVSVADLDGLAGDSHGKRELDAHPWTVVVLQAQKISVSGKFDYPRDNGIEFARRAKEQGAEVFFFSEWGLRDDPSNGPRHEKIYTEMAEQTGAKVAAVGRAWDLALAERTELPLHDFDGNHQSHLGAFLTGCVLAGRMTGKDPTPLGDFPDPTIPAADRQFLASIAAKSINGKSR